jgi:4-amino-4-deoxy-L-arabinose transferase-like glycosyltransferase
MKSTWVHLAILVATVALVGLPNLGKPALWDMDEGVNAECGREMMESGTWIVPTFNWELRTAKPVLIYWLHRASYSTFGVSEWSARFPAAVMSLGSVLVTYWLARRMFDPLTGLLAGVVLATAVQFALLAHASTPDAPLIFFVTLTTALVWWGQENGGKAWCILPAIPCGLAVLTKGPVALGIPGMAYLAYFLWNRELRRVFDWRLLVGFWLFVAVVVPWVAFVAAETRGEWITKFLKNENVNRIATAQENHSGPPVYYLACLIVLFAPWSSVIGVSFWYLVKGTRRAVDGTLPDTARASRFLLTWFFAFLIPFSFFATKLPNYIAPLYPALAILTARYLVQWMRGEVRPASWVMPVAVSGVALTGLAYAVGMAFASGQVFAHDSSMRVFPGLEKWAWVGGIPLLAAAVMGYALWRNQPPLWVVSLAVSAVLLIGLTAGHVVLEIDKQKGPKYLVFASGAKDTTRDIRLATLLYATDNQSLVFYAERRIEMLSTEPQATTFLAMPHPSYLFVPEPAWQECLKLQPTLSKYHIAAQKYDYTKNCIILVVTNE